VIGSGAVGLTDGDYANATFRKPQGMVLHNDTLYVADTQNHAIRAVDLLRRTVTTAAGTGEQGYDHAASGAARETALASPWDIAAGDGDELYIAMAGLHQIWRFNLATDTVSWLVGSGREGLLDAPFESAELAQPSGLVYRDGVLYFADSESSTIRAADLTSRTVTTLAGTVRNDLFDFGDKDGGAGDSRLQHPLGVALGADGLLYIADTYNNKIKQIDPAQRQISTLFGQGGEGGFRDGDAAAAAFDEPGGLAYANGTLFVADTNNGVLRAIDLTAGTVRTISFPNPAALQIADQVTVVGGNSAAGEALELPPQTVAPGAGQAELTLELPEGYKLNTLAPFSAEWSSDGAAVQIADADRAQSMIAPANPITLPLTFATGSATLRGDLTIYYCEAVNESLCFIDRVTLVVPVQVATEAANGVLILKRTITPPAPEPLK
jgi:sugar lactone lactonase YvrE